MRYLNMVQISSNEIQTHVESNKFRACLEGIYTLLENWVAYFDFLLTGTEFATVRFTIIVLPWIKLCNQLLFWDFSRDKKSHVFGKSKILVSSFMLKVLVNQTLEQDGSTGYFVLSWYKKWIQHPIVSGSELFTGNFHFNQWVVLH